MTCAEPDHGKASPMSKSYSPAWRLFTVIVLRPLLHVLVRNKWAGRENIPKKGPVIIAPNHMSYADWGTDALFFYEAGRYPTFMIKASAFKVKFIGTLLYGCGQIPVQPRRGGRRAGAQAGGEGARRGRGGDHLPRGRPRRATPTCGRWWPRPASPGWPSSTGAPVIPVARWGTQDVLPYGSKKPKLWPRQDRAYGRRPAGRPVGSGPASRPRRRRCAPPPTRSWPT